MVDHLINDFIRSQDLRHVFKTKNPSEELRTHDHIGRDDEVIITIRYKHYIMAKAVQYSTNHVITEAQSDGFLSRILYAS